jgi:hypothetical protein
MVYYSDPCGVRHMAAEHARIDIQQVTDFRRLAEEVSREGRPRVVTRNDEELVVVSPAKRRRPASKRTQPVTEDDPLFALIGIGASNVPGGLSGRKHEAQAEAHRRHLTP